LDTPLRNGVSTPLLRVCQGSLPLPSLRSIDDAVLDTFVESVVVATPPFLLSPLASIFVPSVPTSHTVDVGPVLSELLLPSDRSGGLVSSSLLQQSSNVFSSSDVDIKHFYMNASDLPVFSSLPMPTFLSLESPSHLLCGDSTYVSAWSCQDVTQLSDPVWSQIFQSIVALRPIQNKPFSSLFPDFNSCQTFSAILKTAAHLSSKELDVDVAVAASSELLSSPETGLDTDLLSYHTSSILNHGLFYTLAEAQVALYPESLSPFTDFQIPLSHPYRERLLDLAYLRNPVLLPPGFCPNRGLSVSVLPASIAPPSVLLAHFVKEQRARRAMIITFQTFLTGCRNEDVAPNVSNCFTIGKLKADLGRLLLNCPSLNHEWKKAILAARWGFLSPAMLVDLCQNLINAKVSFPDESISGARRDVDSAYMRILMHVASIPLCAILLVINGARYVALLLCNHFGLSDSNYHFGAVSAFFLFESDRRLATVCDLRLASMLTDDFCIFGPLRIIGPELQAVGADFRRYLGRSAVSEAKDVCAIELEMGGALFNCDTMMLRITQKGFASLLHYFFTDAPDSPAIGDLFPIRSFQRLGSLAIYYANFLSAGLPFSRGFHKAIAGYPSDLPELKAKWTVRAIGDLYMWRVLLIMSLNDSSWLTVPVYRLVLLRRVHPCEDALSVAFRHAASATAVAYSDGCIINDGFAPNGLGGYQSPPHGFWFSSDIEALPFYSSLGHTLLPTDINLIEFIALIITLRCMIYSRVVSHGHCHNCHFHIWSDNTSCLAWIRRNRALQPLHYMLLQLFSLLQIRYGVLVTVAHIPGWANLYADAPSRNFHVPLDTLPHIREVLSLVPQLTISRDFIIGIIKLATSTSDVPSQQVQGAHTLLVLLTGAISAVPMVSL
jgi:hypothetical protein